MLGQARAEPPLPVWGRHSALLQGETAQGRSWEHGPGSAGVFVTSHIPAALRLGLLSRQEPARCSLSLGVFVWMVSKTSTKTEINAVC